VKIPQKMNKRGRPPKGSEPKSLFGKKLRSLQGDRKNSDFEEILSVSHSAYANYLSGERVPDARALCSLQQETGVDLNWLLNDQDKTPETEWPVLVGKKSPPAALGGVEGNLTSAQCEVLAACSRACRYILSIQEDALSDPAYAELYRPAFLSVAQSLQETLPKQKDGA